MCTDHNTFGVKALFVAEQINRPYLGPENLSTSLSGAYTLHSLLLPSNSSIHSAVLDFLSLLYRFQDIITWIALQTNNSCTIAAFEETYGGILIVRSTYSESTYQYPEE